MLNAISESNFLFYLNKKMGKPNVLFKKAIFLFVLISVVKILTGVDWLMYTESCNILKTEFRLS